MFQEEAPADGRRAQVGLGFRETGMDQGTFRGFFWRIFWRIYWTQ
jgi:hypothetical protein